MVKAILKIKNPSIRLQLTIRSCLIKRIQMGVFLLCCLLSTGSAIAEDIELLSTENKTAIIETIAAYIGERYVSPDNGKRISSEILRQLSKGRYTEYNNPEKLARVVDADLEEISGDKHLALFFDPQMNKDLREPNYENDSSDDLMLDEERRRNFGFRQLAILPGNVGYLDLRIFYDPHHAGDKFVSAMDLLSDCDALIIDLRNNGGGWGQAVALLSTYFFPESGEQKELSSVYSRPEDKLYQSWTLPYVPGNRLSNCLLYILVSKSTFSAAEEFCYNLKQLERATLVGETTRGGAHPVDYKPVGKYFVLMLPEMTSIHPLSKTNWEGVGVEPDIKTTPALALQTAHLKALEELAKTTDDEKQAAWYNWHLQGKKAGLTPANPSQKVLKSYTGKYGSYEISLSDGVLYYSRGGRMKHKLLPLSEKIFAVADLDNLRFVFDIQNSDDKSLVVHFDDGRQLKYSGN